MIRDLVVEDTQVRYIFFSGKGGVGKSTIALSTAVWLADHGLNTLLVSTDVQPSLDDMLGLDVLGVERAVPQVPNLTAYSVKPADSYRRHRQKLQDTLRVLDPDSVILKQMAIDAEVDCGAAQAALFELSHYLNNKDYDRIVFDTAPTGMLLEKILSQVKYTLSMAAHIEERSNRLEAGEGDGLAEQIRALEELKSTDEQAIATLRSAQSAFFLVLTPEAMPLAEVERNVPVLEHDYGIPVRGLVINRVVPPHERDARSFWRQRWAMQSKYISLARSKFPNKSIQEVFLVPEVSGLELLRKVGSGIYGEHLLSSTSA
jgi:arsenite-transporting ATPase